MGTNVFKISVTMSLKPRKSCSAGEYYFHTVIGTISTHVIYSLIDDDNFIHALRVYRDRMSGAIRLQASVHEGDMRRYIGPETTHVSSANNFLRAPVWTAFITHHIDSPYWFRRVKNMVLLRELKRVVFFPEYSPPRNNHGEHILQFTSEGGVYLSSTRRPSTDWDFT